MTADRPHGFAEAPPAPVLVPRPASSAGSAPTSASRSRPSATSTSPATTPKVLTYQSAKGLTFDTVLMPRLVRKSFTRETDDLIERPLFASITRAMTWVCLSSTDPGSLATLGKVREAQHTGSLAVRGAGEFVSVGMGSSPGASGPPAGDGLLNLL